MNPVHAADVDQFMPAWVHRAAPCVRASLHLVAKVGHFAPLFFRRFASLRYSFADLEFLVVTLLVRPEMT